VGDFQVATGGGFWVAIRVLRIVLRRLLSFGNLSLKGMKSILSRALDKNSEQNKSERKPVLHENIRGVQYYN